MDSLTFTVQATILGPSLRSIVHNITLWISESKLQLPIGDNGTAITTKYVAEYDRYMYGNWNCYIFMVNSCWQSLRATNDLLALKMNCCKRPKAEGNSSYEGPTDDMLPENPDNNCFVILHFLELCSVTTVAINFVNDQKSRGDNLLSNRAVK